MTALTEKQAFQTMVLFLENFYQRTNSNEIGGLLSDLMMLEDGITADPAAWEDWQNCIQHILKNQSELSGDKYLLKRTEELQGKIDEGIATSHRSEVVDENTRFAELREKNNPTNLPQE